MGVATIERNGKTLSVHGELDFDAVAGLSDAAEPLFATDPPTHIDLSGVIRANSAGIALLVEWLFQARHHGQELTFINVPAQMRAIIALADLDSILPLHESAPE